MPINDRGEIILEEFERLAQRPHQSLPITDISNALGTINPVPT